MAPSKGCAASPARFWRRRADKRKAVEELLSEQGLGERTDRELGRRLGVSHQLVARVRHELAGEAAAPRCARRGATTYRMNTNAINAARIALRNQARKARELASQAEPRRQAVEVAYREMRARLALVGTVTPAGLQILQQQEWRALGVVTRLDAEMRAAADAFIGGQARGEADFRTALGKYEWTWSQTITLLKRYRGAW